MKKRINIQYSIDESQIGNECYRLLSNSLDRLTSIAASSPKAESIMNVSTINEIKGLRQELSNIDIMLEDVNAIIDGFLNYKYVNHDQDTVDNNVNTSKKSIPNFMDMDPKNIDLGQLTSFVQGLKDAHPSEYDLDEINKFNDAPKNINPDEVDQDKIQQTLQDSKNLDPQQFETKELVNMLKVFQTDGAPNIDEIGERLANLKSRVESSEVTD